MNGYDIAEIMEEIAPQALACDWDSVGVMAGSLHTEISGIMLCLDLTQEVLEEAVSEGCNMIITHHPLIFKPIKNLSEDNVRGALLSAVVREKILVFSAHTNLDFADGGVNDALIKQIGAGHIMSDAGGHHRYGDLPCAMTVRSFVHMVDEKLCADGVRVIIPSVMDENDYIKRIGVSCGSFDGETDWIRECEVDIFVTGEIKHSEAVDLEMEDFVTVSAGHYPTEIWGVDSLAMMLGERLMHIDQNRAPEIFVSSTSKNPLGRI